MDQITQSLGKFAVLGSAVFCFVAAVGYAIRGDWQHAAYAFFFGCLESAATF